MGATFEAALTARVASRGQQDPRKRGESLSQGFRSGCPGGGAQGHGQGEGRFRATKSTGVGVGVRAGAGAGVRAGAGGGDSAERKDGSLFP